jgi:cytoskeletal protein CcmA (bactofilin family)
MKNYNNSASCCILEKDSSFKGEFKSECDFRVDGNFEGSIETNGKVVIGKNGRIEGTVVCSSADIEGTINGIIHVKDLLSIRSTGEVKGDVVMSKLVVESGAIFNAKSSMKDENAEDSSIKNISNFNENREKTA